MKRRKPKRSNRRSRRRGLCQCSYCIDGWLRKKESAALFANEEIKVYLRGYERNSASQ